MKKKYIDKFALLEKAKTMQYGSIPFSMLYNEPTADVVEVKHGEWIKHDDENRVYYACSVCHMEFYILDGTSMNYCPNCGSEMEIKKGEKDGI